MKIFLWILFGIVILYVLFAFLPSLICFLCSYRSCGGQDLDRTKRDLSKTQYRDQLPAIVSGIEWYRSLEGQLRRVTTESYDGLRLSGNYLDRGSEKTAILFHGYNTTIANNFGVIGRDLAQMGFNLLFVDQRAFGNSEGRFCTYGLKERYDVLSWIRFAEEGLHAEEILLFGVSMGGAGIAFAADKIDSPKVKALVIDCAYHCLYDVQYQEGVNRHLPIRMIMAHVAFFAKIFCGIDIRESTERPLAECRKPVLFIHGTDDRSVPLEWERKNYQACASEKDELIVEGAGHATAYVSSGAEGKEKLKKFTEKYFSM